MITIITTYADNGNTYQIEYASIADFLAQETDSYDNGNTTPNRFELKELSAGRVYATHLYGNLVSVHTVLIPLSKVF